MNRVTLDAFNDEIEKIAAGFAANIGSRIVNSKTLQAGKAFLKNPMQEIRHGMNMTFRNPHNGKLSLVARDEAGKVKKFDTAMRGLFVAGTGSEVYNAARKEDPTGQGRSRAERVGRAAAGTAVGLGTMRALGTGWSGVIPGMALGMAGSAVGAAAGRGVAKMMGHKKPAPAPQHAVPAQPAVAPAQVQKPAKKGNR